MTRQTAKSWGQCVIRLRVTGNDRRVDFLATLVEDVAVRIIKETALLEAGRLHPDAAIALQSWRKVVRLAEWKSLHATRKTYPHADAVSVESGRTVTIFNISGNKYRLITALHYNRQIAYILRFLTHAEYSKNRWKNEL